MSNDVDLLASNAGQPYAGPADRSLDARQTDCTVAFPDRLAELVEHALLKNLDAVLDNLQAVMTARPGIPTRRADRTQRRWPGTTIESCRSWKSAPAESLAAGSNRSITSDDLIDGPDRLSGQRAYPYSVATTAPSSPAR